MRDRPPLSFRLVLTRQKALMFVAAGLFTSACCVSQWTLELGYGETFLTLSPDDRRYHLMKYLSLPLIPFTLLLTIVYAYRSIWRFTYLHASHLGIRLPRAFISWDNYLSHHIELQPVRSRFIDPPVKITINVENPEDCDVRMNPVRRFFALFSNLKSPFEVIIAKPEHSVEFIDKMLNRCRDTFKRNP